MYLRKLTGGIAVSAALVMVMTGCTGGGSEAPAGDGKLAIGALVDVASFDPAQSDVGHYMQYLQPAYDTLIRLDDQGELQPMLAESWEYIDETNTTLELKLREGVEFSDGTPLTAEIAAASLERFAAANGPRSSALAAVDSYDAVDDTTLVVNLSTPDPALTHNLTLPAGMITNPEVADDALASVPAGTGPYVLDEDATRRGDVYVFTRNENYYDPDSFPFDEIDVRVLTDATARLNAVKTGQVDSALGFAPQKAEAEGAGLEVISAPGDWQGLFIIDREGTTTEALGDARVRQAINYAIDGDAILETVVFGEGSSSTQMFYPGTPAYDDALNDAYPFDPEKAKELLAEAGYADGFTLRMPSTDTFLPEVYPIVQQQLGDVGITVEFSPQTPAAGLDPYLGGEFPAYVFSWGSSQNWLDATLLLSEEGAWNPLHAADPEIADLMSRIAVASVEEQEPLYRELSAHVVDEAWFAPFYVVNNLAFHGPDVEVTPQPQQSVPSIYNYKPAGS
ncbi:ABC transporter substrate-binding protein [Homoserinibacter sp. YIM 151385]|uniref:ABC transporter substrate-binding protein n=1 Tax=Homoserinibacter sp. YIM 151385 TaxID=2985506 RepID=UPI0022F0F35F|nr:ABC transporter substrate-binding protein [Homoserinibacter sp. YIM 151385]WBU37514.1 ABC transporter substrate-binding protein [Homoserinibacter sp. YIM 151385]